MRYGQLRESALMFSLARKVKWYLDLSRSAETWPRFAEILKAFSVQARFEPIAFDSTLSRTTNYSGKGEPISDLVTNAPYRLYDYPDRRGKIQEGRISFINRQKPYLVLSLHLNPAGKGHPGGMAAVLSPGYRTFETLRLITLKKKPRSAFFALKGWQKGWLGSDPGFDKVDSALGDAWVYFHGFRSNKGATAPLMDKNRGIRQNFFTWRYQDPPGWEETARTYPPGQYALKYEDWKPEGKFWEREQSKAEKWRREDGPAGFGGDNHYASDELMRYIQYGVRLQVPSRRGEDAVHKRIDPFVSAYTLPIYSNAIVAFLEVGHLNRTLDREVIIGQEDAVARSLAVGVYSLFSGLKLKKGYGTDRPRGKKLDFAKYEKLPEGNYFQIVTD